LLQQWKVLPLTFCFISGSPDFGSISFHLFWVGPIRNLLTSGLDSGSSWLDDVNGILMQQELDSLKQDYWN
jgi:hypothetical protein